MATHMARGSKELFLVALNASLHSTNVSENGQPVCSLSSDCSYIALLQPGITLEIISLHKAELAPAVISNVVSLRWEDLRLRSNTTSRLVIFDKQQCVKIYTVELLEKTAILLQCTHTTTLEQLLCCPTSNIPSCSENSISFLRFYGHRLVLLSDRKCLYYDTETKLLNVQNIDEDYIDLQSNDHGLLLLSKSALHILNVDGTTTKIDLQRIIKEFLQVDVEQVQPLQLSTDPSGRTVTIALRSTSTTHLIRLEILKTLKNRYASNCKSDSSSISICTSTSNSAQSSCNIFHNFSKERRSWHNRRKKIKNKTTLKRISKPPCVLTTKEFANSEKIHYQYLMEDSFYIIFESSETIEDTSNHLKLGVLNFSNGSNVCSGRIKKGSSVIQGNLLQHPILVFDNHHINVLIENHGAVNENLQEAIIDKFIMYAGTATAEQFSTMNNWQSIHLPIQLLNLGLKNRLIDTVAFYIKNTCTALERSIFATSMSANIDSESIENSMKEIKQCIDLVLNTIHDDMREKVPMIFSKQLALILRKYLTNLLITLSNITTPNYAVGNMSLQQFTKECMQCLLQLHHQNFSTSQSHLQEKSHAILTMLSNESENRQDQTDISTDPVVGAIVNRRIPLCQSHVSQTHFDNNKDEDMWKKIYQSGQKHVLKCLEDENLEDACNILKNLGANVKESLFSVFEYSNNKTIQALLLPHVTSWGFIPKDNYAPLDDLRYIHCTYPCTSFTAATQALVNNSKKQNLWSNNREHSLSHTWTNVKSTGFVVSDKICMPSHDSDASKLNYSNLTINWMKEMDSDLIPLLTLEDTQTNFQLGASLKKMQMKKMIQYSLLYWDNENEAQIISNINALLRNHHELLSTTDDMISSTHEFILCGFDSILKNVSSGDLPPAIVDLMNRFSTLGTALNILSNTTISHETSISSNHFTDFVDFCAQHKITAAVFALIEIFKNLEVDWAKINNHSKWFTLMPKVKKLSWDESGESVLEASVTNMHCLQEYTENMPTLAECNLDASYVLAGLATMLCIPTETQNLNEMYLKELQKFKEEFMQEAVLKEYLKHFLILMGSLFPSRSTKRAEGADVSVLLQYNTMLRFQQPHRPHSGNMGEIQHSPCFPHFSSEPVMKLNGHRLQLDFAYYLRQGRPFYAFIKFVTQETLLKSQLIHRRIRAACVHATQIAIRKFQNSSIVCACIAFLELLGQNSMQLRTKVAVKNSLSSKEISNDPKLLLTTAQNAMTNTNAIQYKNPRFFLRKIFEWKVVLNFNKTEKSEAASAFLVHCATTMDLITFTIFAQLYGFEKSQVLPLLNNFPDSTVQEHLKNSLLHHLYKKPQFLKEASHHVPHSLKNTRYSLYHRIGLTKTRKISRKEKKVIKHTSTQIKDDQSTSSESTDSIRQEVLSEDFLGHLVKSDEMSSSRYLLLPTLVLTNSVLPILAASCYEASTAQSTPLETLCVWLIASADEITSKSLVKTLKNSLGTQTWIEDDLKAIMKALVQSRACLTIDQSCHLFQKKSILSSLMKFLGLFFENHKDIHCNQQFKIFLDDINKQKEMLVSEDDDVEETMTMTCDILWNCLKSLSVPSELHTMLEMLYHKCDSHCFMEALVSQMKSSNILSLLHHVKNIAIYLPCQEFVKFSDDTFDVKILIDHVLKKLLLYDQYNELHRFTEITNIHNTTVIIAHLQEQCKRSQLYKKPASRMLYSQKQTFKMWMECHHKCQQQCIPFEKATNFFLSQMYCSNSHCEKFFLLHLALSHWPADYSIQDRLDMEIKMWQHRIQMEVEQDDGRKLVQEFIQDPLLDHITLKMKNTIQEEATSNCIANSVNEVVNKHELAILTGLIHHELDTNHITNAWHLAHIFNHHVKDLKIILTCMDLAEGNIDALPNDVISWLGEESKTKVKTIETVEDRLMMLEMLHRHCQHGRTFCNAIVIYYKIATSLSLSYSQLVEQHNAKGIIILLLKSSSTNKLRLARNLLDNNQISEKEIVLVLSKMMTAAIKHHIADQSDQSGTLDPDELFQQITPLCSDPAALGYQLLETYEKSSSTSPQSQQVLALHVSLLLHANKCFGLACNTEGITSTLQLAKSLIMQLAKDTQFTLLIKLFIGIGHYSDMQYVFELLREHKQLDLLLKKNFSETDHPTQSAVKPHQWNPSHRQKNTVNNRLKQALVEFVYANHLYSTEWFMMIALRFNLSQELAKMLVATASKKMEQITLSNQTSVKLNRDKLQDIQEDLTEAAKHYLQDECFSQASKCVEKAQLIALQNYLLPGGPVIINLTQEEATKFISSHPKFLESLVVSNAYRLNPWLSALYDNVITRGNIGYLQEFYNHMGISKHLLNSIIHRFNKENNPTTSMQNNYQKLLQWTNAMNINNDFQAQ